MSVFTERVLAMFKKLAYCLLLGLTPGFLIAMGRVMMNGKIFTAGDIILLEPGEAATFEVLEDAITVVVKAPSVMGDKYPVQDEK